MSEGTMVVTAPPVSSGGAPGGFGSYNPGGATSVPPGQAQAQMFHDVLNGSFFKSQDGVDRVNENDLTSLLQWVKNNCYLNDCIAGPAMGTTGISAMADNGAQWRDWQLGNMSDQLRGGPYSVGSALANFFWGNGRPMNVDINNIGLQLAPQKIAGFND